MRILFVALMALTPTIASADYFTGNDLHRLCSQNRTAVSGYVAGWFGKQEADAYAMVKLRDTMPPSHRSIVTQAGNSMIAACIPEKATLGQITDVVCNTVASLPEVRHEGAEAFVSLTLRLNFPCPN